MSGAGGSIWGVTVTAFALGGHARGRGGGGGSLRRSRHGPARGRRRARAPGRACARASVWPRGARRPARERPGPRRQVNERWLDDYRGWVYGLGFGAQLGLGVTTVVTSAATYATLLACALSGAPGRGALIGAVLWPHPRRHAAGRRPRPHPRLSCSRCIARMARVAVALALGGGRRAGPGRGRLRWPGAWRDPGRPRPDGQAAVRAGAGACSPAPPTWPPCTRATFRSCSATASSAIGAPTGNPEPGCFIALTEYRPGRGA